MYRAYKMVLLLLVAVLCLSSSVQAQYYYGYRRDVGGVLVDANGLLSQAAKADSKKLMDARKEALQPIEEGMEAAGQRTISLAKLCKAIQACQAANKQIPDSIYFLGGLTGIDYVFVDSENNDLVLVGPAEAWTVGPKGVIVGKDSGKPVLLLEDLIVAMRSAAGQRAVMSVSIDPSEEGLKASREYTSSLKRATNPKVIAKTMEEKLGNQVVTFTGVEEDSHFAAVMAAADYRMKQISMGATKSPLKSLPSFVSMVKNAQEISGLLPRWWLAPNYDGMKRSEDGQSWSMGDSSVVTMTETETIEGKVVESNDAFKKWADKMTENYEELSKVEPIFGQLKACMDCAMVAAIAAENGVAFDALTNGKDLTAKLNVPKAVPSTAVVAKKGPGYMFTNGGVSIDSWKAIADAKVVKSVGKRATVDGENWWK